MDFSESGELGLAFSNTESNDGVLGLKASQGGSYETQGFVDVTFPSGKRLFGKTVVLRTERINSLHNGGFEDGAIADCEGDEAPDSNLDRCGAASLGAWFAEREPNVTETQTDGEGNTTLKLNQRSAVQQFFRTSPGTLYRLSMRVNTSCMTPLEVGGQAPVACNLGNEASPDAADNDEDQILSIKYQAHLKSSSADVIEPDRFRFTHLYLLEEENQIRLNTFDDRAGWRRENLLFRTLDCGEHVLYESGAVAHDESFSQKACASENEDRLVYGALSFGLSWYQDSSYNNYFAQVDNVFLDRDDQIEVVLMGEGDEVLQSSTVASGFFVRTKDIVKRLRIYLRSDVATRSPRVSRLQILDAMPLEVSFSDHPRDVFGLPRMGTSGTLPPKTNWDDAALRSLKSYCEDFAIEGSSVNQTSYEEEYVLENENGVFPHCWHLLRNYGASRLRTFFPIDVFDVSSADDGPLQVEIASPTTYERMLHRFSEMVEKELDVLMLLMPLDDAQAQSFGDDDRARHVVTSSAAFLAERFKGGQTHTGNGYSLNLPLIDDFETFNEINITKITWADADQLTSLQNDVCEAITSVRHDANISSSGLSSGENFFPTDYVQGHIDDLTCPGFTHSNYHPYAQGGQPPEEIGKSWVAHWGQVNKPSWANRKTFFGEYGFSQFKYDPYCGPTESGKFVTGTTLQKWVRGYGEREMAKLVARATIKALQQPAEGVYYWSPFTNGEEAYGGGYDCWKRHETLNHHLFVDAEQQSESGDSHVFASTAAGRAWLRIAHHLSSSSPHVTAVQRLGEFPARQDEHYYAAAFTVGEARYLALWWYRDYLLGNLKENPNSAFMNYLEGTMDDGFGDRRGHTVVLANVPMISSATSIIYGRGKRPRSRSI